MRQFIRVTLACFVMQISTLAIASNGTLSLGVANKHDGESSRVVDVSLRWPTSGRFELIDEHEVLIGFIEARRAPRLNRPIGYAGYGIRTYFGRWFTGFGVLAVSHTSDALSSGYQFASTGGVDLGRASLTLRHLSNSGLRGKNRGETFLSVGYNW